MTVEKNVGSSVIRLAKGDITDLDVEAFVYDVMEDAKLGTGYGSAIMARGGKVVQDELDAIGSCPKGAAVVTSAGRMKAKFIIHVNGPKFHEPDQEGKLAQAVQNALKRADEKEIGQLAFPPIGTGFYQVDLQMCARVMVDVVTEYLRGNTGIKEVIFVGFDTREFNPFKANLGG
ncbi:MAG: macro domain-containing protein [Myxococcota bacterium]|nr:macro domain-containing protein [Myxococcota bacterium]